MTPDGSALVYVGAGESGEGTQLWIRAWNELSARPIPGTEGARSSYSSRFALSPDGREVVFIAASGFASSGPLRVAPLAGGPSRTLAEGAFSAGWSDDGWVYFLSVGTLHRVRASGGPAEPVTERSDGERYHSFPQPLPGGRHLLFGVGRTGDGSDAAIWSLDLETRERKLLTPGTNARYTASGHLLFGTYDGQLMAAPFDARRAELTGDAVPVAEGLATQAVRGNVTYSVSDDGRLVYWAGASGAGGVVRELVWVTRSGEATLVSPGETLRWSPGTANNGLRLSPDGRRVAFTNETAGNLDIWTKVLPDGAMSRLTFDEVREQGPTWTPDGRTVTFSSERTRASGFPGGFCCRWAVPANGAGQAEFVFGSPDLRVGDGVWSPDGKWLVFRRNAPGSPTGTTDILALQPGVDSVATPLIVTEQFRELYPAISRDGLWLAYTSNEAGRNEVFVRPFPDVNGGKWQVSNGGGKDPVWAHNGRELFFLNAVTGELEVAEFTATADSFVTGRITALFSLGGLSGGYFRDDRFYDVALDDQRFLTTRPVGVEEGLEPTSTILVQNFFEELKELVPN